MIKGQVHFWLRVEMVVKKNLMFVVVVVVVTFLQDPCTLNQCYRTWMVTCRCWCMSDVATQLLFGTCGGWSFRCHGRRKKKPNANLCEVEEILFGIK